MNRRHTAYCCVSSAVRLGVVMGLHLNVPENLLQDKQLREHRKRVWWTAYIIDRSWAAKLGHPVSVQEDDSYVDPPSDEGLETSLDDFGDCSYALCSIELATLSHRTIVSIYGRRKQHSSFSLRVQSLLKDLTKWAEKLPPHLQISQGNGDQLLANHVLYLHLRFNQVSISHCFEAPVLTNTVCHCCNPANTVACSPLL